MRRLWKEILVRLLDDLGELAVVLSVIPVPICLCLCAG